ncbi:SAM-dependent methyltransferase, partial [Staphylococcus pseudintermedius]
LKEGGRVVMVHRAERMLELVESMRHYCIEPKRLHMIFSKPGKAAQTLVVSGREGVRKILDFSPLVYI